MIKSIFSLIVISLSAGFAVLFVMPLYKATETNRADLVTINTTFSDVKEIQTLINNTTDILKTPDAVRQTQLFDAFLPGDVDPIRFANNLRQIGLNNKLALTNIKVEDKVKKVAGSTESAQAGVLENTFSLNRTPGEANPGQGSAGVTTEGKFAATKASFNVTATYAGFNLLLNHLEKSLGLINVTSLSFQERKDLTQAKTIASKTSAPVYYDYTVEIETYSLK